MATNDMGFDPSTFPNLTRETALKQRAQQETNSFQESMLKTAALLPQKDRGMFISAGALGRSLAQAIAGKGTQLSPKEVQGLAIMENSNKGMRKLQASSEWGSYSQQEKAFKTQDNLAKAALDAGDYQMFSLVSQQTAKARQEANKAKRELDKIDADISSTNLKDKKTQQEIKGLKQTFDDKEKKVAGTYAVKTDDSYGFAGSPRSITGVINDDGQLVSLDGEVYNDYMSLGDFDSISDNIRATNKPAKGKAAATPLQEFTKYIPKTEQTAYRKEYQSLNDQMGIITHITDVFKEAMSKGVPAESVVGTAGGFINLLDKIGATVRGTTQVFTSGGERQPDGTIKGGTRTKGIQGAVDAFGGGIKLPDGVEEASAQASRYKSAVMQAVYVDALSFESGAKQLSDGDVKSAMQRLGVASGNPATVLRVMTQTLRGRVNSTKGKMQMMEDISTGFGVEPGKGTDRIYGRGAFDKVTKAFTGLEALTAGTIEQVKADRQGQEEEEALPTTPEEGRSVDLGDGFSWEG